MKKLLIRIDFWELDIPSATKNHLFHLLSLILIKTAYKAFSSYSIIEYLVSILTHLLNLKIKSNFIEDQSLKSTQLKFHL